MSDVRIESFKEEVEKVFTFLHNEYARLQTGRANAALVESVNVDAYGQKQPLKAVAGVSIQDARTIVIQPWDNAIAGAIESALSAADIGASPVNDGNVIRLNLPPMTEERRTQLTKVVHSLAEDARISVRQLRQHAHDKIKDEEKDEDLRYTLLEELEKAVKASNEKIEVSKKEKDEEVMKV